MYECSKRWLLCALMLTSGIATPQENTSEPAPSIRPTRVTVTAGQEVTLPSLNKKATVLFFLSCECPIANAFAPEICRIVNDYNGKDVTFFRVYTAPDETVEKIAEHTKAYGYEIPAIRDPEHALVKLAGARITPEVVVIEPDGALVYRGRINDLYTGVGKRRGTPTTADLRDVLDTVLTGKATVFSETRAFGCYIADAESSQAEERQDSAGTSR